MNDDIRHHVSLPPALWRKSSHSGSGDQCVEVALLADGHRAVRDSKNPAGPVLLFGRNAWRSFLDEVRSTASTSTR